jgi:S-adenosylmethionine-dependent methyltransferase
MSDNVRAYYDQAAEREWNRLMTTSQIEYFITLKVINDVIDGRKGLRILDLGGGPGRYAIELSKQGHEVILVDLSEGNLELATKKADDAGVTISRIVHASAVDLSAFDDNTFDLALSLGPMYHLTDDDDLAKAGAELLRVVKPDALALVAFITKLAVLRDVLARGPERLIEYREHYDDVMQRGVTIQPLESGFTDLRLFNASEIEPLMTRAGFIQVHLIGCEGPMNLRLYDNLNQLDPASKNDIFSRILQYAEWPTLLDSSDHLLYIGRKKAQ